MFMLTLGVETKGGSGVEGFVLGHAGPHDWTICCDHLLGQVGQLSGYSLGLVYVTDVFCQTGLPAY